MEEDIKSQRTGIASLRRRSVDASIRRELVDGAADLESQVEATLFPPLLAIYST